MRPTDRGGLRAPARVVDLDLDQTDDAELAVTGFESIWCLARRQGVPVDISFWTLSREAKVSLRELAEPSQGCAAPQGAGSGVGPPTDATGLTVVVCTRRRTDGLARLLSSLRRQSDPGFSLVVVDNDREDGGTAGVVERAGLPGIRLVREPRPGLSRARNRGLAEVATELVAWIDDDEVADVRWVEAIKRGFQHPSAPAAVAGLMLPLELVSEAQVRFEQYGGFNKGRGIAPEVLRAGTPSVHHPLYPLPSFGPGGNMAFRTEQLRAAGGFDPYLGAGTRTHGGEETRVLSQLLASGAAVLHWPPAITWHQHRREMASLRTQFFGYSAGLSAFYASVVRSRPLALLEIVRLLPHALRDMGPGSSNQRSGHLPDDFPIELLRAGRRGLLMGAPMYAYEALIDRGHGRPG